MRTSTNKSSAFYFYMYRNNKKSPELPQNQGIFNHKHTRNSYLIKVLSIFPQTEFKYYICFMITRKIVASIIFVYNLIGLTALFGLSPNDPFYWDDSTLYFSDYNY